MTDSIAYGKRHGLCPVAWPMAMACSMADGLWLFSVHHELEVESAADAELAELLKRSAERDQPVVRTLDDRCVRNISCLIHRARSSSDIESPAELSRRDECDGTPCCGSEHK